LNESLLNAVKSKDLVNNKIINKTHFDGHQKPQHNLIFPAFNI